MIELEAKGAHNINFVTPTHFAPAVVLATKSARKSGLKVPIVYNTSSFDTESTIDMLSESVDIYLSDLKYHLPISAKKYSWGFVSSFR